MTLDVYTRSTDDQTSQFPDRKTNTIFEKCIPKRTVIVITILKKTEN